MPLNLVHPCMLFSTFPSLLVSALVLLNEIPWKKICEDKSTYSRILSGKGEYEWTTAARNSSNNFKNMNRIIPGQTGLSNRKLASKVKCQLQVDGIHSYLEIYGTHLYLQSIKHGCSPMIFNPGCTLESRREPFFSPQTPMPRFNLPVILV